MYVKRIQLSNYGPISRADITCPFDEEGKPKPVVLVGENGSGKSIVLSHIVNGLLLAQQISYHANPEVTAGKVYKFRSAQYIQSGQEYSFSRVDFESGLYVSELQLRKAKQDNQHLLERIAETDAKELWDSMAPDNNDNLLTTIQRDKKTLIERIFSTHCVLYFPPNRFEEPAWLNQENLEAKAQYTDPTNLLGDTERKIINYSPLRDNNNWLFDVAYDYVVFEIQTHQDIVTSSQPDKSRAIVPVIVLDGFFGRSKNLFDIASKVVQTIMPRVEDAGLGFGKRWGRVLSVLEGKRTRVPNIFQLSNGEVSLLNLFLSILRDYDFCGSPFGGPEDLRGIVVVDEIDLHLHAKHQYEILPNLIKMFPRIQFIVTTHAPLFTLGLQKTFGRDGFAVHHFPHGEWVDPEEFREFEEAYRAFSDTRRHADVVAAEIRNSRCPIIYVDGKTDVKYLTRAMELLEMQEVLGDIQIRDCGGSGKLKNVWRNQTNDCVEDRLVILLHDCEDKVPYGNEANVFRWTIPLIESHPIKKGIENRFSRETLERAKGHKPEFIDIEGEHPFLQRGVVVSIPEKWEVNSDEKNNLCRWLCDNGELEDFAHFRVILDKLGRIVDLFQSRRN